MSQISIFDGSMPLKITKPIRLIECFAGYGSQALALKYLVADFEHWKIAEWAVKSIQAYKDMHFHDDDTDYSIEHSKEWLIDYLYEKGISADYNKPMRREQIARMGEEKIRTVYNNIIATNNLVSVTNVHGKDLDITDTDKYTYMLTYSFPCQDLSSAGLSKGMEKGSGTRSGLLWEIERILDECDNLPQILVMENVPEVIGSKNAKSFSEWFMKLDSLGYTSWYKIINAKDCEMPQNRERCFMVSALGDYYYDFPDPKPLKLRLKNVLEDKVDEKYYLSDKTIEMIVKHTEKKQTQGCGFKFEPTNGDCVEKCISTRSGSRTDDNLIKCEQITQLEGSSYNEMTGRVYSSNGLSPTIRTFCGGGQEIKIMDEIGPSLVGGFGTKKSNSGTQWYQQDRVYDSNGIAMAHCASIPNGSYNYVVQEPLALDEQNKYIRKDGCVETLTTDGSSPKHNNRVIEPIAVWDGYNQQVRADEETVGTLTRNRGADLKRNGQGIIENTLRIRKLTPKECFRLMGVKDEDFERVATNQSDSSLYHLAGDSIVTNCLMAIFEKLLRR